MIEIAAPAKLTLSLRVTGVRADGYHSIDAEMVTVDLADTLDIDPESSGLSMVAPDGTAFEVDTDGPNLVDRALDLVELDAAVRVTKRIPAGAGLGGGSADAAAVLRFAGYEDLQGAASIGADVAFCLIGGRARVRGMGERVESLPFQDRTFTVMTPPLHCCTAQVYARWDAMGGPRGDHGNDLEPAALEVVPELAVWRDELAEIAGQRPRLAGSGSSWFVEGAHPGPGRIVTRTIRSYADTT